MRGRAVRRAITLSEALAERTIGWTLCVAEPLGERLPLARVIPERSYCVAVRSLRASVLAGTGAGVA